MSNIYPPGQNLASFDFQEAQVKLVNSGTGPILQVPSPATLPNRSLYFGILLNDLLAWDIRGALTFSLDNGVQYSIPIVEQSPITPNLHAFNISPLSMRLPMQWVRVRTDNITNASDFDLSQSPDLDSNEIQFRIAYANSNSGNQYVYIVRLGGWQFRAVFNSVKLVLSKCRLETSATLTPGMAQAFLAIKSY